MFKYDENKLRGLRRVMKGEMGTRHEEGWNGAFQYLLGPKANALMIVSDEEGWEHVSIHVRTKSQKGKIKMRMPNWCEMCRIKDLFWPENEVVVQYHPKKSEYVNTHPLVLHLWRPTEAEMPTPPKLFV